MAKPRAPKLRVPAIQLAVPLATLFLLSAPTARAEIKVSPAVSLRETYSDNVNLSTDDNTRGQFITELAPSLSVLANGPRLKLLAHATGHLYAYSGERADGTNSSTLQLDANGKANLIDDLLYVDGNVNRSRQSVSAFGQQYQNDYSNANSDTVTTYSISPYLTHRFGASADGQLRYTHDGVKTSRNLQGNSTGDSLSLLLASGPSFTRIGWQLQAYHQQLEDPIAGKSTTDTALGTVRLRARQDLSLYTTGGYDRYEYEGLGGTTAGKNYSVGFTWTPSLRTSIDASAGRRYFGKTYSLAATHRSRKTIWTTTYRDEITTARAQFLQPGSIDTANVLDASFAAAFPDPIARRQAIDAYIKANGLPTSIANNVNYFSNRLFLQKQFQASVVLNGSRSTAVLSVNNTKRLALSSAVADNGLPGAAIPDLSDNTSQRGVTMALSYRLSSRSAATFNASKSHVLSLTTGLEQNQTLLSLGINRQFDRKLSGALELRHNQGSVFSTTGNGYRENAITATLSYRL